MNGRLLTIITLLLAAASSAFAQGTQSELLAQVFSQGVTLAYIAGAAVAGYLLAVIFTALTLRTGYPPNMARLGCWLGSSFWLIFIGFVLFKYVLQINMPRWFSWCLLIPSLFFGVMLLVTRRHPAQR